MYKSQPGGLAWLRSLASPPCRASWRNPWSTCGSKWRTRYCSRPKRRRPAPCGRQVARPPMWAGMGACGTPPQDPAVHIQPHAASEAAVLLQTPCISRVNSVGLALRSGCRGGPGMGGAVPGGRFEAWGGMGVRVIPDRGFEGWGNGNWECVGW